MFFCFSFFTKKENAIFLDTFFGQAKKRIAPAAAETRLTASIKQNTKRKLPTATKTRTAENQPTRKHKNDNTNPKKIKEKQQNQKSSTKPKEKQQTPRGFSRTLP